MNAQTLSPAGVLDVEDDLELDVRIVESGEAADVLLADTSNGCDTVKTSQC